MSNIGIIPYGSDDASVVLRSTLKSAAEITSPDVGTVTATVVDQDASVTFDSELGLLCGTAAGGYNDGYIKFESITGDSDLNVGGQLSIEVESDYFATLNTIASDWAGNRVDPGSNGGMWLLGTNGVTESNFQQLFYQSQNGKSAFPAKANGGTEITILSKPSLGRWVTLTWSWHGSSNWYFFDGQLFARTNRHPSGDLWNRLNLGTVRNRSDANTVYYCDYYMRNLQISTRPVMLPIIPNLRLAMVGDSLINGGRYHEGGLADNPSLFYGNVAYVHEAYNSPLYQGKNAAVLQAYFTNRQIGNIDIYEHGTAGDTLADMIARRATVLADNPTHVLFQIGSNNSAVTDYAGWGSDFADEIAAYFAAGVEKIIVSTIPTTQAGSISAAGQVNIDGLNAQIRSTIAAISNVKISDIEPLLPLGQYNFQEEVKAVDGNIHLATNGMIRQGNKWAETLYSIL